MDSPVQRIDARVDSPVQPPPIARNVEQEIDTRMEVNMREVEEIGMDVDENLVAVARNVGVNSDSDTGGTAARRKRTKADEEHVAPGVDVQGGKVPRISSNGFGERGLVIDNPSSCR